MIKTGEHYRHCSGKEYEIVAIAKHSETLEDMVVYKALYEGGGTWVRPLAMFEENVEIDGKTQSRFTFLG
ncbi:MAG: protein of unknown function DUF1653 [uncultured bacterium]|nr:MAG: protein of unknown function DUF1653 [uncultured bacterium]